MFDTSLSQSHTAAGPRSLGVAGVPALCGTGGMGGTGAALCWLMRSHRSTKQSSAPEARTPRRLGDHSTQLMEEPWPFSSRRACPGCRTSRTRTMLESCEKVARRWESWGDAMTVSVQCQWQPASSTRYIPAMRSRGGGHTGWACPEGLPLPGVGTSACTR